MSTATAACPATTRPAPSPAWAPSSRAAIRERAVDVAATTAGFAVRSWTGGVRGTVPVLSGAVSVDDGGAPVAVRAELALGALRTGSAYRDRVLRSPRLLNSVTHPVMWFDADDVVPDGDGWEVRGVLGVGTTDCPLLLRVVRDGEGRFVATTRVHRRDLGVRAAGVLFGDVVTLRVTACLHP